MSMKLSFKQTEVGVIPGEWEVESFNQTFQRHNAKAFQIQTTSYRTHGLLPVVDQGQKPVAGYSDQADRRFKCSNEGVIVFGDHTCVIKFVDFDFVVGADGTQLLTAKSDNSTRFHAYALEHRGIPSTGYNRHFKFLKERPFVCPPLPEQRAIARALGDADALIAALDRLIAKKRDIKQATMQQLLTGKTRLPGFSGKWETKRLTDMADIIKGNTLSKSLLSESGINPCILYGELFTTYGRVITKTMSFTNSPEGVKSLSGDVLLPGSTTTTGADLATASALLLDGVALGGDINIVRQKGIGYDPAFLACYLTHVARNEIAELAQGTTIHHLYGKDLKGLSLSLPHHTEQSAIASVISDMDTELTALEARRDKTRALKQGMMQELLTGKTRLI